MKQLLILSCCVLFSVTTLCAGESKIYPIQGPVDIQCCDHNLFTVDVENINPDFPIEGIYGKWIVKRNGQVIHEEIQTPPVEELLPGEIGTFEFEIPMQFLNLDGELEVMFEFISDFDLNDDPTENTTTEVVGCGMNHEEAIETFIQLLEGEVNANDLSMFVHRILLKPGTEIKGSGDDQYFMILDAFYWLAFLYDPYALFEQPAQVALLNSNTEEIVKIEVNWPPNVGGTIYKPTVYDADIVLGDVLEPTTPPASFDFETVPSIPMDSVCAILVAGSDIASHMQQAFNSDVQKMKEFLTHHKNGPRIPESSVITKYVQHGFYRDSLLMEIRKLKDKYSKVYFYYSGHGSKDGAMCTGNIELEWTDYGTFVEELFNSGANSYCIMLDDCYAGSIIDYICADPHLPNIDVDVVAASTKDKVSYANPYLINGMTQWLGKLSANFFWTVNDTMADQNGDQLITFNEAFEKIVKTNYQGINDEQCPTAKNMQNRTEAILGAMVYHTGELFYGNKINDATIYVEPVILQQGTFIRSFDHLYEFSLPFIGHVAWVEWAPNALFAKPVTYAFINPADHAVEFHDGPTFWPTVPGLPGYDAFDPEQIYQNGINYLTGEPLNTIHEEYFIPPDPVLSELAIIMKGHEPSFVKLAIVDMAISIFNNILLEKSGDKFHEDQIKILEGMDGPSLANYLQSLQLDKIHFYYIGNISTSGQLVLGDDPDKWMSFPNLYDNLLQTNANNFQLYFDGSNSGNALTYFPSLLFSEKQVDIFTSSDAQSLTYIDHYVDEQMNRKGSTTPLSYYTMLQYGNPSAESDGIPGTTLKEAFNQTFITNPIQPVGPLWQVSNPLNFSGRYIESPGNIPETIPFSGLGLDVEMQVRSAELDLYASQEFNVQEQTTSSTDVFEISPVRRWKLIGTWDPDPSLKGNLVFHFHEDIDLLAGNEGILGLVSRASADEEWEAYYPVTYNEFEKTITAENVHDLREWAIARVRETSGTEDGGETEAGIHIYPNPVTTEVNFIDENNESWDHIEIVNVTGKVVEDISTPVEKQIDVSHLYAGIYFIRFINPTATITKRIIKRN